MPLQRDLIQINAFFFKIWLITRKRVFHIFEILFWPAIGLVSVGLLTRFLQLEPNMVAFILIGVIALSVVQVGQLDISYVILYSVWNKSLKQEMAAPTQPFHLIAGTWAMGVIHSLLIFSLLSIFSRYAFDFRFLKPGLLPLALFYLGLALTSAVVGIVVCALAFRFGGRSHVGATSIVSVLILLSGIYYPVEVLPAPLKALSALIPLTYFLEYFRSFYGFPPSSPSPLALGYVLVFGYVILASLAMHYALNHSRKTGILLKMSE
ncbi:MAG: ABC transporter permease [Deltaproteobacteria bacterium]|nr:ABC transporter permease [Deltaproteobacteria bacterium]MBW2070595.1 ABC transporter permease [Deltaproteobacteria bacterium]